MVLRQITTAALAAVALLASDLVAARSESAGSTIVKGTISVPNGTNVRDVVVYLEGAIGAVTPGKGVIDQKDSTFVPHVATVVVGGSVDFLNSDPVLHNVFSTSPAKHFDLGMFGRGESRGVTFDKPGVVEVRCNVHPKMQAFILVLENNYFAVPDEQGRFQLSGIPAGRHKLRAWHPALRPIETWVNLDEVKVLTVDLRLEK